MFLSSFHFLWCSCSRKSNAKKEMSNKDMISSLPDDILDKILVRLLLSEAIITSFLSKQWRHKWSGDRFLKWIHTQSDRVELPDVSKFDNISFKFKQLKIFDMYMAFGSKSELIFFKFVLGNAFLLETYKVEWSIYSNNQSTEKKMNILIELSFKRASSSAEASYCL